MRLYLPDHIIDMKFFMNTHKNTIVVFAYLFVILLVTSCNLDDLDSSYDQIILSNQDKALVESANNLGFDLLKLSILSKSDEKILISPLQLSSNINLLLNGTAGSTFESINSYINPTNISVNEINNSYKRIFESVRNLSDNKIILLNSFWFKTNSGVKSHFSNVSEFFYKTQIDSVDFNVYSDDNKINDWVKVNSEERLSFENHDISSETNSLILNAFLMELSFKYHFNEKMIEPFWISSNDTIMIPMLKVSASFNNCSNLYFSLIEIPYNNESFSLMILLPNQGVELRSIIAVLNSENWNNWINSCTKSNISLSLPEVNITQTIDLTEYLDNSEIDFLSSVQSDFSPITSDDQFKIDHIFSVSEFEVYDELDFANAKFFNNELYDNYFQVNRPFFFAIKENSSNLVLQTGIISNPKIMTYGGNE